MIHGNIIPNEQIIRDIEIAIETHTGRQIDITPQVVEVSIYETLYVPFLYGEMVVIDTSAMLSSFPFIGQEKLIITFKRFKTDVTKEFWITDIFDVKAGGPGLGGYGLSFTSEKQIKNASSLFSRSFRGRGDEIIGKIYNEYISKTNFESRVTAKTSHNIVFPWIKPFQAIEMITQRVLASDSTPMFLYDTLYSDKTVLNSFKNMMNSNTVFDIASKIQVNDNVATGTSQLDLMNTRGQIYAAKMTAGYDTLDALGKGVYGSFTRVIDIAKKETYSVPFDYKVHAPAISNDYISNRFKVKDRGVNTITTTKQFIQAMNTQAFNDDYPNLNSVSEMDRNIMASWKERMKSVAITLAMDSLPELSIGSTVNYTLPRFAPKLNTKGEDYIDPVTSGKYLISSIRHFIKKDKYQMSIELIRDGVGETYKVSER